MSYIPLFVQSEYCYLKSALRIEDIFKYAQANNNKYCALCDDNSLTGLPHLYEYCSSRGIKPIVGIKTELQSKKGKFPICLFVKNEDGYISLCNLLANKDNLNTSNISKYKKGLILIIPTITNEIIHELIESEQDKELSSLLFALQKGFEEVYLGVEYYTINDRRIVSLVREYASSHSYKTIAFPLNLYLKKKDAIALSILNSIKEDKKLDENQNEGPYYMLNEKAWSTLYLENEISATEELCSSVSFELNIKRGTLLSYPIENDSKKEFIKTSAIKRLKSLNKENDIIYLKRIDEEINIIEKMGFLDYFLVVSDFINYAKDKSIPIGPGRGSACGSLISYLLNITEIDPIQYGLIFERFLNPDRITMPDIDIDISDLMHEEVMKYIEHKYSSKKLCSIKAVQKFGAKQALRDIGSVLGVNGFEISLLSSYFKDSKTTIDEIINSNDKFASLLKDNYLSKIISYAKMIEGLPRQESIHPAGIILNNEELVNCLPLDIEDGRLIAQYEAPYLEEQGFLKMDILKLTTLSLIDKMVHKIKNINPNFDYHSIPLNDEKTFEILNKGLSLGLFQIESEGITKAMQQIQINSFEDIYALLALYRPGPMDQIPLYAKRKNNKEKYSTPSKELEEILLPTYGIIIYQEQIMNICQKCASFTYAEADLFRRAISKKDSSKIENYKDKLIKGCENNGISHKTATEIYDLIYKFSEFGFNKSHAVAYAHILYKMAFIKANYPASFYEAMLDNSSLSQEEYFSFKKELDIFNLSIKTPDINLSKRDYVTVDNSIYVPFTAIKGLPQSVSLALEKIQEEGQITDYLDFMIRSSIYEFSEANYTSLIDSGVLDSLFLGRKALKNAIKTYMKYVKFFYKDGVCINEEFAKLQKPSINTKCEEDIFEDDKKQFALLGFRTKSIISSRYQSLLNSGKYITLNKVTNFTSSSICIISHIRLTKTKKNQEQMAILSIYDDYEYVSAVLFPSEYKKYGEVIKENKIFEVQGYMKEDPINGKSYIISSIKKLED